MTATDANGCTDTARAIVNVDNPITIIIDNVINNGCVGQPNGSIAISVIGGSAPFSYQWSNGQPSQDLINVRDDNYTVTVTDANGCSVTAQASIVPNFALNLSQTIVNPPCAGDSATATVTANGGSGNYGYDWGNASNSTTNVARVLTGQVIATVTDRNTGCVERDTFDISEPDSLTIMLIQRTNIGCDATSSTGSLDLQTNGGTPSYQYNWSNNAMTEDISGLTVDNYTLTVTDANGCTITAGPFAITQATAIAVTVTGDSSTLSCDQQPTGVLSAQASGGTGITYQWNTGDTSAALNGLAAGTYTVIATNDDNCTDTASATILAPLVPSLAAFVQTPGTRQVTVPLNTVVPIGAGNSGFACRWTALADPSTGDPGIADPNAENTTATPNPAGQYTYVVTATATTKDTVCRATDTVFITVELPFLGIPDAFTPNNDGVNDVFRPIYLDDGEILSFRIFNRWGQVVYDGAQNENAGWDGTFQGSTQPTEVYLYWIEYRRDSEPEGRTLRGQFTLLR